MLADKHSFLGCTKILREVLGDKQQARSLQAFDLDKEWIRIGQALRCLENVQFVASDRI